MPLNGLVDHLTTSNLSQRKIFLLLLGIDIAAYPVLYWKDIARKQVQFPSTMPVLRFEGKGRLES